MLVGKSVKAAQHRLRLESREDNVTVTGNTRSIAWGNAGMPRDFRKKEDYYIKVHVPLILR